MSAISDGFGASGRLQAPVFELRRRGETGQTWRVRSVELEEQLSGRFSAAIDLDSEDATADPAALLSASAALEMRRPGGTGRRFCGVIRAVTEPHGLGWGGRRRCQITLEPAFLCLDEEVLTRPFVGLTVPQILREVLAEALGRFEGRALELRLQRPADDAGSARAFAVRDLCVQYHESTYDFCRRLMAEEGLSHFFDHRGDVETLVIVDEDQFQPAGPPLPVLAASGLTGSEESLSGLTRSRRLPGGWVKLKPFDYLDPHARWDDSAAAAPARGGGGGVHDPRPGVTLYGYAQGAYQRSDLVPQTEIRRQQRAVDDDCLRGSSNVVGLMAGQLVAVREGALPLSPWAHGEFLVTEVVHSAVVPEAFAAGEQAPQEHHNTFTLLPRPISFRPAPVGRPTALEDWALVLSSFEQDPIDTDRHGRVRVQFLYDGREEVAVERRSPWIPVSQFWAGSGYGAQIIPRAGMLARIEYIFGDPDRPVVAECFPTGTNRVPAALPQLKTRLTLRSKSLRDGGRDNRHFNEIALDDAADQEQVFLRAGRNLRRKVLHDDRTQTVHDEVHTVGGDQKLDVFGRRSKTVHAGETETVVLDRRTTVEANDTRTVSELDGKGSKDQDAVDGAALLQLKDTRTTTVEGLEKGAFKANREEAVEGLDSTQVSGVRHETADVQWKAAQGTTSVVLEGGSALVSGEGLIESTTEKCKLLLTPEGEGSVNVKNLSIICGSSRLTVEGGKVRLKAATVVVRGADGAIKLDVTGAKTIGKDISSSAKLLNEIKGALVVFSDTPGAPDPLAPKKAAAQAAGGPAEQLRLAPAEEETQDLEATLLGNDLKPAANARYQVRLPTGELFQGMTDASGKLKQKLPGSARTAGVSYEPADGSGMIFRTMSLVDDDSPEAPVAQLRQLGCGGDTSPPEEVIREFQGMCRLEETGQMDPATKDALAAMRAGRGLPRS